MTHAQGPVVRICVEEISLGRTRGAKKAYDGIARAAASSQWRLPFMVRAGLRIRDRGKSASQWGLQVEGRMRSGGSGCEGDSIEKSARRLSGSPDDIATSE